LSNFSRLSSISVLPINFFRYFSKPNTSQQPQTGVKTNSLIRPRLTSFVAIPMMISTSAIISAVISVIEVVGGTPM
jgi:hypothetical protein